MHSTECCPVYWSN